MALFKRQAEGDLSSLPPPPTETPLAGVYRLLDEIGICRLKVQDPKIKVLLTQIAQNGEHRLTGGGDEPPSDIDVVEFRSRLDSVVRVLAQYVEFQDNPSRYPSAETDMNQGRQAIVGFASYVMKTDVPGGSRAITDFRVDTNILSAQQYR